MTTVLHFMRDGEVLGQYPEDGVAQLLQARAVVASDYYWHEGMAEWAPVWTRWPEASQFPCTRREVVSKVLC